MGDTYTYENGRENVEELKNHQLVVGYTIFRAIKENKNISSMEDFYNFFRDVENDFNNLKSFHKI